jgi:hypothetical protein
LKNIPNVEVEITQDKNGNVLDTNMTAK